MAVWESISAYTYITDSFKHTIVPIGYVNDE